MRIMLLTLVTLTGLACAQGWGPPVPPQVEIYQDHRRVVADTAAMVRDAEARRLASRHGFQILDLTWEDTGRFKNSAVGPNISDMTIQVQLMDPRTERFSLHCMPVIRYPNFSDRSCDVPLDRFYLLVGNQRDRPLHRVSLRELLGNLRRYLHDPHSWKGLRGSLLAPRDSHALVSAQACFLPVPREGIAEFNPVLFNYQSVQGDPAVLTILATREGTSVTVIDNVRDAFQAGQTWGQRLFFNLDGRRAVLTGQRLSSYQDPPRPAPGDDPYPRRVRPPRQQGLNLVLLVQVPLKQKRPPMRGFFGAEEADGAAPGAPMARSRRGSDVEDAVIGHGRVEGPFTEIDGLAIERDPRFPIRVTVQFYKATSNGVVNPGDMDAVARQIERVYRDADYVGSLVTEGPTGRPTEHDGPQREYPGWWDEFWLRYERNTNISREQALELLHKLHGPDWFPASEADLTRALEALH
jgi:hypothetical protein